MRDIFSLIKNNKRVFAWLLLGSATVAFLLIFRLGSLVGGMSEGELKTASATVGWHGIYHDPLYLPIKLVRSFVFFVSPDHGQTLSRLPSIIFGFLTLLSFATLVRLWHGTRTAVFATILFGSSAWFLHASRLASNDVLYLWATPTLLLGHLFLQKYSDNKLLVRLTFLTYIVMLYVPGLLWFILGSLFINRRQLLTAWSSLKLWPDKLLLPLALAITTPLLIVDLTRPHQLVTWIGLPDSFGTASHMLKEFFAVPLHLFVRGPQYPEIWLGRAPILDIFCLFGAFIGIYFYVTHREATRSKLLACFGLIALVLVGLAGPVGLSVFVPLLYLLVAMGIAYLLHDWLKVFPNNPFAKSLGIGLIVAAVSLSCLYNLRSYFVAWPHNPTTQVIFQYHR